MKYKTEKKVKYVCILKQNKHRLTTTHTRGKNVFFIIISEMTKTTDNCWEYCTDESFTANELELLHILGTCGKQIMLFNDKLVYNKK